MKKLNKEKLQTALEVLVSIHENKDLLEEFKEFNGLNSVSEVQ